MCPPALDRPEDMVLIGSDEEAFLYLDRFKPGSPLPRNVIENINPYQYRPSNLPNGIWYIVQSVEMKKNEFGVWEVKQLATEVFENSSIIGWKTTLEFLELQGSLEQQRTNWVMEEYRITQKGERSINKEKELRSMCRVLFMSSKTERHPNSKGAVTDRLDIDNLSRNGSPSGSLVKNAVDGKTLLSVADKLLEPWRDISEHHHVYDGDYLELDDLADPQSLSSSSDNSSRSSMTFGEYFDPIALLEELEDNANQEHPGNDSSSRFNITASTKPFEVVIQPASSGSLVYVGEKQQPSGCKQASSVTETKFLDERIANHTIKRLEAEQQDQGPSHFPNVAASSSTTAPIPSGKKESAAVAKTKKKKLKKYFCFMPF